MKVLILIVVFFIVGCKTNTLRTPVFYESNFVTLISEDELIDVPISNKSTLGSIKSFVCKVGCKDKYGYTGRFSLRYSVLNRSFINTQEDTLLANIPLLGYKCKNSNMDFFYSSLKLYPDRCTSLDSVGWFVKKHILEVRSRGNDSPVIDIMTHEDMPIEELSELIFQILNGYYNLINGYSNSIFKKDLCGLKDIEGIRKLHELEPLLIRLRLEDSLYCQ